MLSILNVSLQESDIHKVAQKHANYIITHLYYFVQNIVQEKILLNNKTIKCNAK